MDECLSPSRIEQYLRGALSAIDRGRVEAHIEACSRCHDALIDREIEELLPPEEAPASPGPPPPPTPAGGPEDDLVGAYRLVRELGRGGQACVYLAEDTRLPRRVALKVFHPGLASSHTVLLRFKREAAALSRLDHPGICTVYETGEFKGCPFIAMRYVEGETLATRIGSRADALKQGRALDRDDVMRAVSMIEKTALALHAAHEVGLVHRDVKPSNILIAGDGEPVVLDFGLARDEESQERTLTRTGDLAGTPMYMSPEQVSGQRALVDRRSDVFSLGVTLYEALTLTLPFDAPTTAGVFQKILASPLPDASRSSHHISRDLRVILETALERDRSRRYQTALLLAEDLRRFREHETILARRAGTVLRLKRWSERNPVIAVSLIAIFLILTTALGISVSLLGRVRRESDDRAAALRREEGLRVAYQSAAILPNNPGQALRLAIAAARESPSLAANNALMQALEACHERTRFFRHHAGVNTARFSPDGLRVVTASGDGTARVWDAITGRQIAAMLNPMAAVITAEFSADGRYVLASARNHVARIFDAETGNELHRFEGQGHGPKEDAHFSPDGGRVLMVDSNMARIWGARSGKLEHELAKHTSWITCSAFSSDGSRCATGSNDNTARVWDVASGDCIAELKGHTDEVDDVQFSRSGETIITASRDFTARLWNAASGAPLSCFQGHTEVIYSAALSPDGKTAATGSEDFTARTWDAITGKELVVLQHQHKVIHVEFSPDGKLIMTASYDRTARVWDAVTGSPVAVLGGHAAPLLHASFSPDGTRVATAAVDFTSRIWCVRPAVPVELPARPSGLVFLLELDPTGRAFAVMDLSAPSRARVLDLASGSTVARLEGHTDSIRSIAFSPDGRLLATASNDRTARIWEAGHGTQLQSLSGHEAAVVSARFSGDGSRVVTASEDKTARVWDAATGTQLQILRGHDKPLTIACFGHDDGSVLTAADDGTSRIWSITDGMQTSLFREETTLVRSAELSADGARLLTATATTRAHVWNASTGRLEGTLVHSSRVQHAAYSPDSKWIVTRCEDRIVRVWDATRLEEVLHIEKPGFMTGGVSFTPDGKSLVALFWRGETRSSSESHCLVYPLFPLPVAEGLKAGDLTPDELDQFEVGTADERKSYREAWRGGDTFGSRVNAGR